MGRRKYTAEGAPSISGVPDSQTRQITCPQCHEVARKRTSAVHRAERDGAPIYCSASCARSARRKWSTPEERRQGLREYQRHRQAADPAWRERRRASKRRSYAKHGVATNARHRERKAADPEYYRKYRAAQDLCQSSPEWKMRKAEYDRKRRDADPAAARLRAAILYHGPILGPIYAATNENRRRLAALEEAGD